MSIVGNLSALRYRHEDLTVIHHLRIDLYPNENIDSHLGLRQYRRDNYGFDTVSALIYGENVYKLRPVFL